MGPEQTLTKFFAEKVPVKDQSGLSGNPVI